MLGWELGRYRITYDASREFEYTAQGWIRTADGEKRRRRTFAQGHVYTEPDVYIFVKKVNGQCGKPRIRTLTILRHGLEL